MSEIEPKSDLHIPTLEEITAFASDKYTDSNGSILGANPEMLDSFVESSVDILSQLHGQPKVNYFHSIFFMNRNDQQHMWGKMAERDEDAATWLDSIREQEEAAIKQEHTHREQMTGLNKRLIQVGIGRIATHPATEIHDDQTFAGFSGLLDDTRTNFHLVTYTEHLAGGSLEKAELEVRLPEKPVIFDAKEFENARDESFAKGRSAPYREVHSVRHHVKEDGKRLLRVGKLFNFNGSHTTYGEQPIQIIDEDQVESDRFVSLPGEAFFSTVDNRYPLPMQITTDLGEPGLTAEETASLIKLVENAESIPASEPEQ